MADLKTTNIYGDAYINNKVGIATNAPATRLQIGQLSPTAATEGIQFGDDTSTRLYRSSAGTLTLIGGFAGLTLSASTALYGNYGDWSGESNKIQWHSNNLYFVNRGGGNWLFRNSGGSNVFSIDTNGGVLASGYIQAATYLQTSTNLIYPNGYTSTQRLEVGNASGNAWIDGLTIAQGGNVTVYNNLTVNNAATVTNDLTVNGNTYLGNAGGDTVCVNDIIRIGATDSGDASLFFGEGSVAGSDYGARWYWDGSYTFTWYTRNDGTDTALFDYVTNDTTYLNWRRHFHMQNKEINYSAQIHFNAGTRFVGQDTSILLFRSDSTSSGGIRVQNGSIATKGYIGYWDAGGGGILNDTGNWAVRYNFGSANSGGTLYGAWTVNGNISATNLSGTNTGDQSIGNGTITIAASTGVSVGATNTFTTNQSGATTVTITNTGVTALTTNTGLSTNASATGAVTITNTGVTNISAGTGIGTSASTGAVTITNNGVTSALAGTGVGVSGATGAVTFSIGQAVGTANSPTFAGLTLSPSATSQFQLNSPSATQGLWIRSGYDTDGTATPVASANNIEIQSSGANSGTFSFVCGNTKILTIALGAVNSLVALQQSGNQVLHAGNYNSYALPLAGGTLTGALSGTTGAFSGVISGTELTLSGVGMGAYNLMKYSGLRSGDWQTFTTTEGQLNVIQVNNITGGSHTNYPTGVYPFGAVMSWRTTNHSFQLYAAHTGDLAYKTQWNNDNYSGWRRILDSTNYPYAAAMNQYVRTTDTCSFASLTVSNTINGSVTGNAGTATSATSATYLNSSNYIARCGSSGNANTDFQNTPAGSVRHNGDDSNLTNSPGGTWWFVDNYRHANSSNYWGTQVAWGWEDNANRLATRNVIAGTFGGWVYYLNSANYNSYSPTLTGTGASGTWSINVTGNAGTATSATTLQTARNINGTSFDGSAAITTATWGTARTLTIGSTGKSVDGSAAITWSLAEIGAAATNQTMFIGTTSVAINRASANLALTGITSIDGNAATVTNATFSRQFTVRDDRSDGGNYSLSARATGLYAINAAGTNGPGATYLSLIHVSNADDVAFQIAGGYVSDNMYFRGTYALQNGTGYSAWRTVIHSGNIGSQTVATAGSCTGNAATATTTDNINGRAFSNRDSGNGVGQDSYTNNGIGYVTGVSLFSQTDGGMYASAYSTSWVHQIYGDFRTGQIAIRGKNAGTWQAWRSVLDSSNYTSYAPTLTGTGASGTWSINVTGNAGSATSATTATTTTGNAGSVTYLPGRTDAAVYPVLWGSAYTNAVGTIAYSCAAVTIQSSTGILSATSFSGAGTGLSGTAASLTAGAANSVAWTNVSGRPTAVSSFTNDSGYLTSVTIANGSVTLAKIENITAYTILGNSNASAAATPAALSVATVATMLSGQTMNINGSSTSCSGNAATATVNSGNASVGWYPIVWHSGNTHYSSTGTIIYAAGNYIQASYFNSSDDDTSGITRFVVKNGDGYHRSATTTLAADTIRGVASGTWSITAATANALNTSNNYRVTNFGIDTAPSNKLHINGDNVNPTIRVDNGAVVLAASAASNSKSFYGWLPISIAGTTKWIQMYN